jgi:hypothetical protein
MIGDLGSRIAMIAALSRRYLPKIKDGLVRVNVALRLWSGCLSAAKVIALETRSGPNTPESRALVMPVIEEIAAKDPIYAAGVDVAPAFKRRRHEKYSFDGVPSRSRVLREQEQGAKPNTKRTRAR